MNLRRPAAIGAAAFVIGTLGGLHWGDLAHGAWFAAAAVLLASAWPRRPAPRCWLRLGGALLLGWALAAPSGARMRASLERLQTAADRGERITLEGDVVGTIRTRPAARGESSRRFTLNRLERLDGERREPLPRQAVSVIWYGPAAPSAAKPVPRVGERWRMTGRLLHARRAIDPVGRAAGFAPIRLMLISRTRASARDTRQLAGWRGWLERRRRTAADRLATGLESHPDEVKIIQAMMLGYRSEMPRTLTRAFRRSGTIHIFAISGLHVVVLAALLTFAASRLGVPRHLWLLPLAPLLALYIIATGAQPSALRAGLMAGLYLLAPLLGRRPDSLTILALSAALLLLANPMQILDIGFLLSFSMVLGLIVLAGPVSRLVRRLLRLDRLEETVSLVNRLGGELTGSRVRTARRNLGLGLIEWGAQLFAVSLAAWLISLPLTAYFFGFFTPYSLLANLFIVPLSSAVMMLATVSLFAASVSSALGLACNQIVCLLTILMKNLAVAVAAWPGAAVPWSLPLAGVAAWYAAVWGLAWRETRARERTVGDATWLQAVREPDRTPT